MLHPETGQPNASFENVLQCMDTYGKLIGVIHVIIPLKDDENNLTYGHSTNCFFSKGYVHTATGFAIDTEMNNEVMVAKCLGLNYILCMIPGLAPIIINNNFIENHQEKIERFLNKEKSVYFVFLPANPILHIQTSPGYHALENALELINEEIENEEIENEEIENEEIEDEKINKEIERIFYYGGEE